MQEITLEDALSDYHSTIKGSFQIQINVDWDNSKNKEELKIQISSIPNEVKIENVSAELLKDNFCLINKEDIEHTILMHLLNFLDQNRKLLWIDLDTIPKL